ncbi:uncharacterized protein VP01_327g2 [Puccinia sorghi]|uniref:Uncharacterized protein n=1 Tax=Puccinia sorghi TaxID=27349 RepID=A0A0L6UXQ5_9BASI|nr:uncharacterized protein VP01_327g2 [Puccinia sorghi]
MKILSFVYFDYKNLCTYSEVTNHYSDLFGTSSETAISGSPNVFSCLANASSSNFQPTGINSGRQRSLKTTRVLLEAMCPCFKWMDAIFGQKANITPMAVLDTSLGFGINRLSTEDGTKDDGIGAPVDPVQTTELSMDESSTPRPQDVAEHVKGTPIADSLPP